MPDKRGGWSGPPDRKQGARPRGRNRTATSSGRVTIARFITTRSVEDDLRVRLTTGGNLPATAGGMRRARNRTGTNSVRRRRRVRSVRASDSSAATGARVVPTSAVRTRLAIREQRNRSRHRVLEARIASHGRTRTLRPRRRRAQRSPAIPPPGPPERGRLRKDRGTNGDRQSPVFSLPVSAGNKPVVRARSVDRRPETRRPPL